MGPAKKPDVLGIVGPPAFGPRRDVIEFQALLRLAAAPLRSLEGASPAVALPHLIAHPPRDLAGAGLKSRAGRSERAQRVVERQERVQRLVEHGLQLSSGVLVAQQRAGLLELFLELLAG